MKLNENILKCHELLDMGYGIIRKDESEDELVIFAALSFLGKAVDVMKAEYKKAALEKALSVLKESNKEKGAFIYNALKFTVSESEFFDFLGHPQKYNDKSSTEYRRQAAIQADCKTQSQICTQLMSSLKKQYMLDHPNAVADQTNYSLSFGLDETCKLLGLTNPEMPGETKVVTLNEL